MTSLVKLLSCLLTICPILPTHLAADSGIHQTSKLSGSPSQRPPESSGRHVDSEMAQPGSSRRTNASCDGAPSPVHKTGQTECWDEDANWVPCDGTGQDGEYQLGVSTSPRFTDNGDGTVRDNLTGLCWLRHASCLGELAWQEALDASEALSSSTAPEACGLADASEPGTWRLPNILELESLIDYGQPGHALPSDHPFSGTEIVNRSWSSTTAPSTRRSAWIVNLPDGVVERWQKTDLARFWPVHDGLCGSGTVILCHTTGADSRNPVTLELPQTAVMAHLAHGDALGACPGCGREPFPVPKTGQALCWDSAGVEIPCEDTGQDGEFQAGISVPTRFTDQGDGTVRDNLTGLVWLKNTSCMGQKNWQDALDAVNTLSSATAPPACDLADGSAAGAWRLPNVKELQSLIHYGRNSFDPLPPGHPFVEVRLGYLYWSSTSDRSHSPALAWTMDFTAYGEFIYRAKESEMWWVWPVR